MSTPQPADATDVPRALPDQRPLPPGDGHGSADLALPPGAALSRSARPPAPAASGGTDACEAAHAAAEPGAAVLPAPIRKPGSASAPDSGSAAAASAPAADPLLDPDSARAADHAATESLLRCWLRETGAFAPSGATLRVELGSGLRLTAPVRHWSACGWHRFGAVRLGTDTAEGPVVAPVDAVTVALLLARSAPAHHAPSGDGDGEGEGDGEGQDSGGGHGDHHGHGHGGGDHHGDRNGCGDGRRAACPHPSDTADLAGRVADSVRRTARFIAERRAAPERPPGTSTFLDAEQALLLGHPMHPTPKSREGMSEAESSAYSPELRGAVRLHWFAVHPAVAASDSALAEPAGRLTERLRGAAGPAVPPSYLALPLHPWQARDAMLRPECAALLEQGLLRDLGPEREGTHWHPTSSVRTVHRPGAPFMLKLSLGLRITNSRRENLRKELHRGVEVHRLLTAGLADQWHAAHPHFDIVRDPAWLAVDAPGVRGLDVVLRDNAFGPHERAYCVAGLLAERPWPEPGTGRPARSRLGALLHTLAGRTGRAPGEVAAEWFERYLHAVVLPVLWLDGHAGIALEAHHQNSLVLVDAEGRPCGGRYRDNQGYYFRASRAADLDARLPGVGQASDTFVEDAVADERFTYYLGINHLLGLIGAMGAQRLADERTLLGVLRRFLAGPAARSRSTLPQRLLDAPTLRCKANLLTRLRGLDELDGPVESQSVYVTISNPVAEAAAAPARGWA